MSSVPPQNHASPLLSVVPVLPQAKSPVAALFRVADESLYAAKRARAAAAAAL